MSKVEVDEEQCARIADILKNLEFRLELTQREYLNFQADRETKLRVYLFSAAICHQTHSLIFKIKNLKGWECLEDVYTTLGKEDSQLLKPEYLATLSAEELSTKLKALFSETNDPEDCTLDKLIERSEIIIGIAKYLNKFYDGRIETLLEKSENYLINSGNGIYELLEKLPGFEDPLKKKSTVFLMGAFDSGLLEVKDPENIVPPMDYHMQRVLLRSGCVRVIDKELDYALKNKEKVSSDEEVREASVEAMRKIACISGKPLLDMDNFFWSLGRSCCRENILCVSNECDKNPCTFYKFVQLDVHDKCILEGVCQGSSDVEFRRYWQPIVDTKHY